MTGLYIALAVLALILILVWIVVRMAGGEDRERASTLAQSAKEQARVDQIMASPLGDKRNRLARLRRWRNLRKDRSGESQALPDDE